VRRLTTIDYPAGTGDVAFSYDAAGNRTVMTDSLWTTNGRSKITGQSSLPHPTRACALSSPTAYRQRAAHDGNSKLELHIAI
jgi:YD repeat-containing protein